MLAQKMVAICDHKGCKAKCRAVVRFETKSVAKGVLQPIALVPVRIKLEDGWSWGWNNKTKVSEIGCPKHQIKK